MTDDEKEATVARLERLHELETGHTIAISTTEAQSHTLYGYAFNISKCRGYMDCVRACILENNQKNYLTQNTILLHLFTREVPTCGI